MEAVIRNFNENGFAILQGILEQETLDAVKYECEALVAELSRCSGVLKEKLTDTYSDSPFETRLIQIYENYPDENPTIFRPELHREGFFGVFAHPTLLELAGIILGPEIRLYPNYSVRPKLPREQANRSIVASRCWLYFKRSRCLTDDECLGTIGTGQL